MTIIVSTITTLATCAIAYITWLNYKMYQEIQKRDNDYKSQTRDLFEGMIIATLLSGPSSHGDYKNCKTHFLQEYKGKIEIFQKSA